MAESGAADRLYELATRIKGQVLSTDEARELGEVATAIADEADRALWLEMRDRDPLVRDVLDLRAQNQRFLEKFKQLAKERDEAVAKLEKTIAVAEAVAEARNAGEA